MQQDWFEMPEIRRRKLATAVWLPLRASQVLEDAGSYGYLGYKEEFFGSTALMVPVGDREKTEELGWSDFNGDNGPVMVKGKYVSSDIHMLNDDESVGMYTVLSQGLGADDRKEWHLHQDIVLALDLKRDGDKWYAFREDYTEVARLYRNPDGDPVLLEFRAELLKDYLAARGMGLYVATFRSRFECMEDASHIEWPAEGSEVTEGGDNWECRIDAIHEGGSPFGATTAVMHISRKDVDLGEDVPTAGFPTDADVETRQWEGTESGRKLFMVRGELWRSEWLDPSAFSPRVRGDERESPVEFIVDADGTRASGSALVKSGLRWLWFRPDVANVVLSRPHGVLGWYTRDTGGLGWSSTETVHFGINSLGLINVLAKDIGLLPEWQQRVWAGFNVGPDGKMSEELHASQVKARPASTQAPESHLAEGVRAVNALAMARFGFELFRPHAKFNELIRCAHRLRATSDEGLFDLAKDLARLTADSFDVAALEKVAPAKDGKTGRSIKALERLLADRLGDEEKARTVCGPLVGIYELRHADAHLPSSDLDEAFSLAGVDRTLPHVIQGLQLLEACVTAMYDVAGILRATGSVS